MGDNGARRFDLAVDAPGESFDQFRRLVESLTDYAIFALSVDGTITSWNVGAERAFGYTAAEAVGKNYGLTFSPEDVARGEPAKRLDAANQAGIDSVDGWRFRKDGSRFWCTGTVQPLRDETDTVTGYTTIVRESTSHHMAIESLRESEELLRLMIEGVTDYAIFSLDPHGTIMLWNSGAEHIFDYTAEEVVGKHFSLIYTDENIARGVPETELATAARDGFASDEGWHVRRDGFLFYANGRMTRLKPDVDGRPRGFVKIAHDVTARKEADELIKRQAFHDGLTRLPNRALFSERLRRSLDVAKRNPNDRFAVIFLDLDRFKIINDSLGHVMADDLLAHVARTLESCVRPGDVVARLGGDEFTILVSHVASAADAINIADRVQAALQNPYNLDGLEVFTTASMGIAIGPAGYETPEDVLRDADTAMYEAKARGRSQYVLFGPEMHARAVGILKLQMDLRRAVARQEFVVEYQPIVALGSNRIAGFEALVRWNHPEYGMLPPAAFLAEAETMGLIIQIDRWVLQEACLQLRAWQIKLNDFNLTVSVNLSSKHFGSENVVAEIRNALQKSGLAPRCLKVEITETVLMEQLESTATTVSEVDELGVEVYIDDFGTGYSSLSYLTRFPLRLLKVDRSFVSNISVDPRSAVIARTVVSLAHDLGLAALAEGIETEQQLAHLQASGCEYGQGYWFSPAVRADVAEAFIARGIPKRAAASNRLRASTG